MSEIFEAAADKVEHLASLLLALALTTSCGFVPSDQAIAQSMIADVKVGETFQTCEGCPEFVRVPTGSVSDRTVSFVGKYEITWNQYLKAFDDGACEMPLVLVWQGDGHKIDAADPAMEYLRVDWPISNLNFGQMECYRDWLSEKSGLAIAIPTEAEWEWFASSGDEKRRFPWGNEEDPTKEALLVRHLDTVKSSPWPLVGYGSTYSTVFRGAEPGQFAPTDWGLFDVLGNVSEMTSDQIGDGNRQVYEEKFGYEIDLTNGPHLITKGRQLMTHSDGWKRGIADSTQVTDNGANLSSSAGLRLLIVDEDS